MRENEERNAALKEEDRAHDQQVLLANQYRQMCEMAALEEARHDKRNETDHNHQAARERREKTQIQQEREAKDTFKHVTGVVTSDRMREVHDYKLGLDGRLIRDEYKRFTEEQEQDVHNQRALQVLERKDQLRAQAEEEAAHAARTLAATAVMGAIEEGKKKQIMDRRQQMVEHNKAMAQAKRENDAVERVTYKSFSPQC